MLHILFPIYDVFHELSKISKQWRCATRLHASCNCTIILKHESSLLVNKFSDITEFPCFAAAKFTEDQICIFYSTKKSFKQICCLKLKKNLLSLRNVPVFLKDAFDKIICNLLVVCNHLIAMKKIN